MLKLIGSNASPFVRKVRVVMAEKKIDYEFILEDVWSASTTIQESNPLGKVPTLETPEGGIFESNAIARYGTLASSALPVAAWYREGLYKLVAQATSLLVAVT